MTKKLTDRPTVWDCYKKGQIHHFAPPHKSFYHQIKSLAAQYPEIQFEDRIVDAGIMQVIMNPTKFDVIATIAGGGKSGQAGALAHGISKALVAFDPTTHKILRTNGFLTRDPRVVERKKYGFKKARKGQTYRKR